MKAAAGTRTDRVILIAFFAGMIGIVYFVMSLLMLGSDPMLAGMPPSYLSWMATERLIVVGMLIIILIIMTYVLMVQKSLEESRAAEHDKAARPWRSEKDVREDIMRYYRDLGALKIVLKDGVMDAKTYNERKKYLEDMVNKRKKQLQEIRNSVETKKQADNQPAA
jgi:hypothetical protein